MLHNNDDGLSMINPINLQLVKHVSFLPANNFLFLEIEVFGSKDSYVNYKLHARVVFEPDLSIAEQEIASVIIWGSGIYVSSEGLSSVGIEEKGFRVCS